jgi:hypothetical protein
MKGIYLTQESKQEIEANIVELEEKRNQDKADFDWDRGNLVKLNIYKEILSSATILPVEESWENAIDEHDVESACRKHYPKGVIIKFK